MKFLSYIYYNFNKNRYLKINKLRKIVQEENVVEDGSDHTNVVIIYYEVDYIWGETFLKQRMTLQTIVNIKLLNSSFKIKDRFVFIQRPNLI